MSRYREIQADVSPSNVMSFPRRQSGSSSSEPFSSEENEPKLRPTPRMSTGGKRPRIPEPSVPPSSSSVPSPAPSPSSSDEEEFQGNYEEDENDLAEENPDESEEFMNSVSASPTPAPEYYQSGEFPFSPQMNYQLMAMNLRRSSIIGISQLGIYSLEKLYVMKEEELVKLCGFSMTELLAFRLSKAVYDQTRAQGLPSGLTAALPVFRGSAKDSKTIDDPTTFISRFEAVVTTSNVHPSRWGSLVLLSMARPEDSAYWRNHLDEYPTPEWSYHRQVFLEHFECYDQRAKYVEAVYQLKQKADEPAQQYFDRAADIIRKAQLSCDDPLVIGCLRNGIYHHRIQDFIILREEPQRTLRFHQLMNLTLMAEDRFKIKPQAKTENRTTPHEKTQRCRNCRSRSHSTNECRMRKRAQHPTDGGDVKNNRKPCRHCPGEFHSISNCPNVTCTGCKQKGHMNYACPKATCSSCGSKGHTSSSFSCPKNPNKGKKNYLERSVEFEQDVDQEMVISRKMKQMHAVYPEITICASSIQVSKISEDSPIVVPIRLEMVQHLAMLDTGASHSILDISVIEELGMDVSELENVVEQGKSAFVGQSTVPLSMTRPLQLTVGKHSTQHQFYVTELFTPLIIGRDLLSKIGISITGIPTQFPTQIDHVQDDNQIPETSSSSDETHEVFTNLRRISASDLEILMNELEETIARNEAISEGDFSNHKEATVVLEMQDPTPIFRPQFDIPEKLQPIVDEQISKWIDLNKIEKTSLGNRWNASLLIVPKQDLYGNKSDWRVCFDARGINSRLKTDTYGIPRIKELFRRIKGFNYCSSLDLVSAYQQMEVSEEYRDILTFSWKGNRYRFRGAPFGLTHLPGQFQRLMNCVLAQHYQYVLVYLDDVFIFSNTLNEHIEHCKQVIQTLTEANLRLRRGKCHFGFMEAVLLGHVISGDNIRADPRKIATFSQMKAPTTGKQLQALLGFASYLRDYIPKYSMIAAPLEAIKNMKQLTTWNNIHEEAFNTLKNVLCSAPVLSTPNFDEPFLVATDSSQFGNGAVLYQLISGKTRYIQFFAKALNKSQINYPATKRELLAIVQSLKAFRYYLYGRHFDLYTDHKALTFLFTSKDPSYMMLNWMEELMNYDFTIHHRPGIDMVLPDALSRLFYSLKRGNESVSNTDCVEVNALSVRAIRCPKCKQRVAKFCETKMCKIHCSGCKIHPKLVQDCPLVTNPISIDSSNSTRIRSLMKEFIRDVLQKKEPDNEEHGLQLIRKEHDLGHGSVDQLFTTLFRKGWYWNDMKKQCLNIANSCATCLQFNISRQGYHPLTTISASLPFDHLAMDLGQISMTSQVGNNFILVVTDICTRFTILRAIPDKSAATVARYLYQILSEFGIPKIIQSDNGKEFINSVMTSLKEHCGFTQRTISSYHPQANGAAETNVKIVKQLLNKYTKGDWSEWCIFIPAIQLGMNTRVTRRHFSTPFSLMFARRCNDFTDHSEASSTLISEKDLIERNTQLTRILYPAMTQATDAYNQNMMDEFKVSHKTLQDGYPMGAMVMKRVDIRSSKSEPRYEGPFRVVEKTRNNAYVLLDSSGALYQKRVPADHLKLISVPDQYLADSDHYEVEKILDHKGPASNREYLVKWKYYPDSDNSWIKANAFDAPQLIQTYWKGKQTRSSSRKKK